jgi:uncharacterized membrane protein
MALIENTVSRTRTVLQTVTTFSLVAVGFFVVFFASAKATKFNKVFDGGISHADVPASSAISSSAVSSAYSSAGSSGCGGSDGSSGSGGGSDGSDE